MKFEVYRSGKQFRFRLVGRNGKIVAIGEAYTRERSCLKTIDRICDEFRLERIPIVKDGKQFRFAGVQQPPTYSDGELGH